MMADLTQPEQQKFDPGPITNKVYILVIIGRIINMGVLGKRWGSTNSYCEVVGKKGQPGVGKSWNKPGLCSIPSVLYWIHFLCLKFDPGSAGYPHIYLDFWTIFFSNSRINVSWISWRMPWPLGPWDGSVSFYYPYRKIWISFKLQERALSKMCLFVCSMKLK